MSVIHSREGEVGEREKERERERMEKDLSQLQLFPTYTFSWPCQAVSTVAVCMGCEVGVATTPEAEEEEVRKQRIKIVMGSHGWLCGSTVIR